MVVADHVQGVVRTNFLASWDEVDDENEMEETFALSTMSSLEGKFFLQSINMNMNIGHDCDFSKYLLGHLTLLIRRYLSVLNSSF